jgi:hypothetical protein
MAVPFPFMPFAFQSGGGLKIKKMPDVARHLSFVSILGSDFSHSGILEVILY